MRYVSGGSMVISYLTFHLRLREATAALNSASPNSTGPAVKVQAVSANRRLIDQRTPASPVQIPINHRAARQPRRHQRDAHTHLPQQELARAEQNSINQHATRNPVEQIRKPVARRLDLRP